MPQDIEGTPNPRQGRGRCPIAAIGPCCCCMRRKGQSHPLPPGLMRAHMRGRLWRNGADRDGAVRADGPARVGSHLPAEPGGVGEVSVEAAEAGSLGWLKDRRAGRLSGGEHLDDLIFGRDHLGQRERRRPGSGSGPLADVGFERCRAEEAKEQSVADLDENDLCWHLEAHWPAEAVDIEATGRIEVGYAERDEVNLWLHDGHCAAGTTEGS